MTNPMMRFSFAFAIIFVLITITGLNACTRLNENPASTLIDKQPVSKPFTLTSSAFKDGEAIPQRHWNPRCGKENVSPQLSWSGAPAETKAFALIVDDPDPAPILHWVVYGVNASQTELPEAVQNNNNDVVFGASGRGGTGWWGPCPPEGMGKHTYVFTLYALSEKVDLIQGATSQELLAAIKGKVIATAVLTGTAER